MPDMLAIAQGLNAIKATTDIIKTMAGLRDAAQILENYERHRTTALHMRKLLRAQQEIYTPANGRMGIMSPETNQMLCPGCKTIFLVW